MSRISPTRPCKARNFGDSGSVRCMKGSNRNDSEPIQYSAVQPNTGVANTPAIPARVPPSAHLSATPHKAKVFATRRGASSLI
jgi:hypothetical protein